MKPSDYYVTCASKNYSCEDKSEYLVLCSGLGGLHHTTLPQRSAINMALPRTKLSILLSSENVNLSRSRNGLALFQASKCGLRRSNFTHKSDLNCLPAVGEPHLVKVSVYTKAVNPYMVIYESTQKYAKPAAYIKLSSYTASPRNNKSEYRRVDDELYDDDCAFRLIPNRHEDVDNSSVITFRAPSSSKRDEWVNYLNATSLGRSIPSKPYKPGSSVLPTLEEEEDVENNSELSTETFQKQTSHNRQLNRRGSLNSLGIRLRRHNYPRNEI